MNAKEMRLAAIKEPMREFVNNTKLIHRWIQDEGTFECRYRDGWVMCAAYPWEAPFQWATSLDGKIALIDGKEYELREVTRDARPDKLEVMK